jgi:hypothetical protein
LLPEVLDLFTESMLVRPIDFRIFSNGAFKVGTQAATIPRESSRELLEYKSALNNGLDGD